MRMSHKAFFLAIGLSAAAAVGSFSGSLVIGAINPAIAAPGTADPKGPPHCDGNVPITSPAKPCNGNNGFGNGGGDGSPNGKPDVNR